MFKDLCFTVQLSRFSLPLLSNFLSLRQLVYIITTHFLCQQLFSFFYPLTCEPQRMLYYHTLQLFVNMLFPFSRL